MITIVFFAQLKELLDCDRLTIDDFKGSSVADVRSLLADRGVRWASLLQPDRTHAAVNKNMVKENAIVQNGDEVAFFPPVTGG